MTVIEILKKELVGKKIKYLFKNNAIHTFVSEKTFKNGTTKTQQQNDKNVVYVTKRKYIGRHFIFDYQIIKNIVPAIGDRNYDNTFKLILENDFEIYFDSLAEFINIDKETLMIL